MTGPIYRLKRKDLNDIKYVLGRPANRAVYDKSETFVRKDKESAFMPSHGSQYMNAFGQISSFGMFVFIMLIFVEKYQHFAKQCVTSSLLIFVTLCINIRMPKEQTEENMVIQIIQSLPFLDNLCYFEIIFILKTLIYPNLFHSILHVSRLIDIPPEA